MVQAASAIVRVSGLEALAPQEEARMLQELQSFFDCTELSHLTFIGEPDGQRFIALKPLLWTNKHIPFLYWRGCYSYILCSTIASFEDAWDTFHSVERDNSKLANRGITLAIT